MSRARRFIAAVGLGLWAITAVELLRTGHPRRVISGLTHIIASLGHGALSVSAPVRLAIAVAVAFALLVPLLAAVASQPRPKVAALMATVVVLTSGVALWTMHGRNSVVDFVSAAVVGTLVGWLIAAGLRSLSTHRSTPRKLRASAAALLTSFSIWAGFIGFWRDPVDGAARGDIGKTLNALQLLGAPSWLSYDGLEFAANIMFFVPLGLLLTLVLPSRWWWTAVVVGCTSSACIELGQAVFLPARTASWDDFAANSIGALLGSFIALIATAAISQRASTSSSPRVVN